MKVSKVIVAPFLALAVMTAAVGCETTQRGTSDLRPCTHYEDEVLDLDDEGECYAPDDDKHKTTKKKSSTKKSSTRKTTTRKK